MQETAEREALVLVAWRLQPVSSVINLTGRPRGPRLPPAEGVKFDSRSLPPRRRLSSLRQCWMEPNQTSHRFTGVTVLCPLCLFSGGGISSGIFQGTHGISSSTPFNPAQQVSNKSFLLYF